MASQEFKHLLSPITIGKDLVLENRIKMPAMAIAIDEKEGEIGDVATAFYVARAKGDVKFLGVSCTPTRLIDDPMLGLYDDRFIPGLKRLVKECKPYGGKLLLKWE